MKKKKLKTLYKSPKITVKGDIILFQLPNFHLFQQMHRNAKHKQFTHYHSEPFEIITGYKFILLIFTNGCGAAKGKSLSIYLQLMKSENDAWLTYPFRGILTFVLLDKSTSRGDHHCRSFLARGTNKSFEKPTSEYNKAHGLENYLSLKTLEEKKSVYQREYYSYWYSNKVP